MDWQKTMMRTAEKKTREPTCMYTTRVGIII